MSEPTTAYSHAAYYDAGADQEWARMDRHRTEFAVTLRTMAEHLPPPPAQILDCGGGPGRYAIELARQGYAVTLFDLSAGCLALARAKAAEAGVTLAGYEQGTAVDLARFPDGRFDVVLLMGPLYHLLDANDRRQALAEAQRVLKPGGLLLAAFTSRYAPLRYTAAHEPLWIVENPAPAELLLTQGLLPPRGDNRGFVAYFAHPTEVAPLCRDAGLDVVTVLGVEGLVSQIETEINALEGPAWEAWVDLNARVAPDPSLHGGVEHLLVVAHKPRWRAVVREIAVRLEAAGIAYVIVGGTAAALLGVPVPVNDIDIETNAEDAYRVQAFFANQVTEPMTLRESDYYRSHLGRLELDGLKVDVMGDLHRREGNAWVPAAATVIRTVDMAGVPVRVGSLEESTLAYIRRGRLERAACCLPYCDHGQLLALLKRGPDDVGA